MDRAASDTALQPNPTVTRMKQDYRWETPRLAIFSLILMELEDFALERRMLKSIKSRAELAERID